MGFFEAARAERRWHAAVEDWELKSARLAYDAAKPRLYRMRRAMGANPRNNFRNE